MGALSLCLAMYPFSLQVATGIRVNKRRDNAGVSVRAVQQSNTPVESQDETDAQRSSIHVESQNQNLASAAGVIVYDGQGEALAPQTLAAPAVLLASDNSSKIQNNSTKAKAPSAGLLEPSPPQSPWQCPLRLTPMLSNSRIRLDPWHLKGSNQPRS